MSHVTLHDCIRKYHEITCLQARVRAAKTDNAQCINEIVLEIINAFGRMWNAINHDEPDFALEQIEHDLDAWIDALGEAVALDEQFSAIDARLERVKGAFASALIGDYADLVPK